MYAINGSDLAVCVVTTINSAGGNSLNITVTCGDPLVGGIDAGQAAIIHPTSEFKYPTYIAGLRDDLRSMIMNRLTQRIDEGVKLADEVALTIGTTPPANTLATVQGYKLAKTNMGDGDLYQWNGTTWVLVGGITENPVTNIYYVGKKFSGLANSSNSAYTTQLAAAKRGSQTNYFPDPWSALAQAKIDLAATTITSALIYVLPGEKYTYGDATSSNNGQADFTTTAFVTDKQVTSATKSDALLNFPNVEYYFAEGSKMANHCKAYPIPLFNLTGTTKEVLRVSGKGNFYNYFGESVTVEAEFVISANKNAEIYFQANSVNMQQWHVFRLTKVRLANIDVSNITTAGAMIAEFENSNVADTVTINFKSDVIKSGEGFFGPYVDYWYGIFLQNGGPTYANFDIGQIDYKEAGAFVRTSMSMTNSIVNINIGNAKHTISSQGFQGGSNGCFIDLSTALSPTGIVSEQNNQISVKIGNYIGDYPVLFYSGLSKLTGGANNYANFECDNCRTNGTLPAVSIVGGAGFESVNPQATHLKLKGSYESVGGRAINVTGKTSQVDINAELISGLSTGVWNSGAVDVTSITLNGTITPNVTDVLFASGSTLPLIGELHKWNQTLKKYELVPSGTSVKTQEQSFTATAAQTAFTLAGYTPTAVSGTNIPIRVYRNGVRLKYTTSFTYSGSIITLTFPAVAGDEIIIEYLN